MNVSPAKVAAIVVGLSLSTTALAEYRLTAFGGAPGFKQIMAEDYASASERLKWRSYDSHRYARYANLCVSQAMSSELEAALADCDRAVSVAPADLSAGLSPTYYRRSSVLTHLYSNRGVVRALNGDRFGAREDFERALELDDTNVNAQTNLNHVSSNGLAQSGE
jgi:tetratricopeptide (TPR) repeat protein